MLVFFANYRVLGTLHRPAGADDLGHSGSSFLDVLILFEPWVGHLLLSEKVTRPCDRANRPISIPSVPFSEGIEIRQVCQFVSRVWLARCASFLGGVRGRGLVSLTLFAESY